MYSSAKMGNGRYYRIIAIDVHGAITSFWEGSIKYKSIHLDKAVKDLVKVYGLRNKKIFIVPISKKTFYSLGYYYDEYDLHGIINAHILQSKA